MKQEIGRKLSAQWEGQSYSSFSNARHLRTDGKNPGRDFLYFNSGVLEEPIFWRRKAAGVNDSRHFKKSELLQLKGSRSHSR